MKIKSLKSTRHKTSLCWSSDGTQYRSLLRTLATLVFFAAESAANRRFFQWQNNITALGYIMAIYAPKCTQNLIKLKRRQLNVEL